MEASEPMILPKGIVINTTNIYDEVASFPIVPAHKVCEYWHVYTTTNKKLQDPTARRLENFWWHVWGSDRRLLSGRALARIYEAISTGPTIAPLRGPLNRWGGPDASPITRQLVVAHLSQETLASQHRGYPHSTTLINDTPVPTSSNSIASSKPTPSPHPILKKARGPSSSGPRPTARFISPHESPDETAKDVAVPSSASNANQGLDMPLTMSKKKPQLANNKKFVVPSIATKRRPLLPRKTSPLSPVQATAPSRDVSSSSTAPRTAAQPRPVSPIPEGLSNNTSPKSNHTSPHSNNVSPKSMAPKTETGARQPGPSAKALGKRPVLPPRAVSEKMPNARLQLPLSSSLVSPSDTTRGKGPLLLPRAHSYLGDGLHSKPARVSSETQFRRMGSLGMEPSAAMERSQSHNGYMRFSEGRSSSSQSLFTGATTASTTNVAAQGTIIDQAGSLPVSSVLGPPSSVVDASPLSSSLLDSRLTPTQPGSSASVPMGRTRSQLTLLLEREKARTGDRPRSKG